MKYRKLGDTDIDVSVICLGTMSYGEQNSEAEAHEQLNYSFDNGVNFIDTAEMYAIPPKEETCGKTEEIIGSWFKKYNKREDCILATKVAGPGMDYVRGGSRLNHKQILEAAESSLKRLKTDYIDLYQVHWPERKSNFFGRLGYEYSDDMGVEIEETYKAMDRLVQDGKVRYVGISNETPWGLSQYLKLSERYSLSKVVSIQNPYSLLNRIYEVGLAEITQHEKVGLLAYSPLGFGVLTGKYITKTPQDSRLGLYGDWFTRYSNEISTKAVKSYVDIAKKFSMTPTQLALSFVNSRPFVTSNIIGATKMEQLKENIKSIDFDMKEEVIKEIEKVHQQYPNPSP
tara:strand:- start:546 stop:1574 length:1029 start_codon:yes stop_codon:yes gene_type:complete